MCPLQVIGYWRCHRDFSLDDWIQNLRMVVYTTGASGPPLMEEGRCPVSEGISSGGGALHQPRQQRGLQGSGTMSIARGLCGTV